MTKRDTIIGLYLAGMPISKIIKQLKVPKFIFFDAVKRYKELIKIVPKVDALTHVVQKQHQSCSREGKEIPQT